MLHSDSTNGNCNVFSILSTPEQNLGQHSNPSVPLPGADQLRPRSARPDFWGLGADVGPKDS